ncbi:hypothetical protein ACFPN2_33900 [Steroidobacter flavus]|uniref:Uncharacterized protein n=1 Tax=Steroidobacter flavus TaxID=1842136 RepID=A0ABV8T3U0_9GAMM
MTEQNDNLNYMVGEIELPTASSTLAQLEESCRPCFRAHRVQLVQLFVSCDLRRAVLIFLAPDAESVRYVCRRAGVPVKRIWACQHPGHLG